MAYLIDSSVAIDLERRRVAIVELRDRFGGEGMAIGRSHSPNSSSEYTGPMIQDGRRVGRRTSTG